MSCPRLRGQNSTTTHHGVNHAVQRVSRLSNVEFTNEPRYTAYVPPTTVDTGADEHEQGPDSTFFLLPRPLTIDVKGVGLANKTHLRKAVRAIEASRRGRAVELYGPHCAANGEDFEAVVFHYTGALCPVFERLLRRLVGPAQEAGHLEFADARLMVQVAIMRGIGRTLLALRR